MRSLFRRIFGPRRKYSSAEYALINLEWFAEGLLQQVHDLRAQPKPNTAKTARLILRTTTELRHIRKSYDPARPQIRSL